MRQQKSFLVHDHAIHLIQSLREHVERIHRVDRGLADQIRRAASSIALNAAESTDSAGGNRRLRLQNALGSAREVRSALREPSLGDTSTLPSLMHSTQS